MVRLITFTVFFAGMFSAVHAFGQVASPTPTVEIKVPVKANERPTSTPAVVAEPFDKADIKTMAAKCVRLSSEAGDIEIELYPENAPESVRNFLNLAATGAFDTTTFSRVVPGFVIQGGNLWTREGGVTSEQAKRARQTYTRRAKQDPARTRRSLDGAA